MKILITTDLFTVVTNGVVTSVRNLRSELEGQGHEVRILTLSDTIHSHRDGAVYYVRSMSIGKIYPNARMPLTYIHRYVDELIEWRPDVIHSQCELCTMPYANHISKATGAPIVHTYHTMYEQYVGYVGLGKSIGKRVVRHLTHRLLSRVSLIIAPTSKMKGVLTGYGMKQPIRVIPTGIELQQFRQRISPQTRSDMRRTLGISNGQPVLVYVGRLGTEKNIEELLEFFAQVRSAHEGLVFLIVGDGPDKGQLERRAAALGLENSAVFAGRVEPSRVHEYYQLGDVFVCASTSEAQGLTYVEAAASGLPMICRKDPCLEELIRQGENGFAYTNEQEFAHALDVALSSPAWRLEAGKRSEELAAVFDKTVFGASVCEAYRSVLGENAEA